MSYKAQASVEFLLVIAAALVVLGSAIVISQRQAVEVVQLNAHNQARNTVQELDAAAREVYSQGEGARKQVFVEIPSGYDASQSFIANRSIKLRVAGSDFASGNDFDMYGSLPSLPGNYWIWVVSEGSRVRIGVGLLSINRASITAVMERNSTREEQFTVKNIYSDLVNVTLVPGWSPTAVTMGLDTYSFPLSIGEEKTVDATFRTDGTALGFYNGYIDVNGVATNASETQRLPVTIEVVLPPGGQNLRIIPGTWNESLPVNVSVNKTFTVCTGPGTSVPSVGFTTTSGHAGDWVGNLTALPAMGADSCLSKTFSLSIPFNTSLGIYGGAIFGSGGMNIEDSVDLTVTVISNISNSTNSSDTTGPIVRNVTHSPQPAIAGNAVTVSAVGDDSLTGNSSVIGCQLRLDGNGSWKTMAASDGVFEEPVEAIEIDLNGLSVGLHNVSLHCTDAPGNVGPPTNYSFSVLSKNIIFITKDEGVAPAEQDWIDWLNSHSSGAGYSWTFDRVHRNKVTSGEYNVYSYRIAVVAEDVGSGSVGATLIAILKGYTAAGGYVVSVDDANDDFPNDMGIAGSGSYTHSRQYIYIINNSHYITMGLPAGKLNIFPSDTKTWRQQDSTFTGNYIATSQSDEHRVVLGEASHVLVWGPTKPNTFLSVGHNITRRLFDYALMSSGIGG